MIFAGWFFFSGLAIEKQAEMRGYFGLAPLFFSLLIPAITMRLLAEERGSGTLELLITMPVRDWEVVVGKFALLAVLIGLTLSYAFCVSLVGPIDKGPAYAGYLGLLLMGGAYAGIGVMASALTRNQIVAFILAFGISFLFYILGQVLQVVPPALQPLLSFLSMSVHFESIGRGVLDSRDVLFYLSVTAISLVIATVSLESRKWK
jgi:ABC-2 type transport system permease protein